MFNECKKLWWSPFYTKQYITCFSFFVLKESNRRPQFEKWFWATLEKMNQQEKQELLFFWTGSPYLPASEEGFQPLPTVTLRPPSDQHLPTANTCINRLYLPMYSSKSILKAKILQAIKTKTFGFVWIFLSKFLEKRIHTGIIFILFCNSSVII